MWHVCTGVRDRVRVFARQLYGHKHVLLYRPAERQNLYANSRYDKGTVCSAAEPYAAGATQAWPRLQVAEPWQCVLEPVCAQNLARSSWRWWRLR